MEATRQPCPNSKHRQRAAGAMDPPVELVALEQPGGDTLRLVIDHEEGVDLALCEQVTGELRDLLIEYSLEVSSPGADRPLTKPEHFRRFLGRKVRVRTADAIAGSATSPARSRRRRRKRFGRGRRRRRPNPARRRSAVPTWYPTSDLEARREPRTGRRDQGTREREGDRLRDADGALEDALLSAYKKTPGAARYARVDLDRDSADFRVFELILPPSSRRSCSSRPPRSRSRRSTRRPESCASRRSPSSTRR